MSNLHQRSRAIRRAFAVAGLVSLGAVTGATSARGASGEVDPAPTSANRGSSILAGDTLYGRSGKLRVRFVSRRRGVFAIPILTRLFGDSALARPGVYAVDDSGLGRAMNFVTLLPFEDKVSGRVGAYRVGFWPEEKGRSLTGAYENPDGFVVVTPENQDLQVSEHFRLGDFLTHDQENVWPKYLVLQEALVDKLELVIEDLEGRGIPVSRMRVMSGFRTPQYNAKGVGRKGGRAKDSRHQFGDAADVFVDNNGDDRMDDLNHDRRIDWRDAKVIVDAVERVELAHPDLAGGGGVYKATRAHGPFAHIDARGTRARWGRRS